MLPDCTLTLPQTKQTKKHDTFYRTFLFLQCNVFYFYNVMVSEENREKNMGMTSKGEETEKHRFL